MENTVYRPDIYEGKEPFIYISYHPEDVEKVKIIIQKMNMRGIRFWMDEGITPGMETDEILAEHIENCDFFVAFLSNKYLWSLDTLDELNYSRDVNKDYLLIYLEQASLPAGLDMRFMRAQSINAYDLSDEEVFNQLLTIQNIHSFYGITDSKLRNTAERVFEKLERLYPEHKVFALDAVGKQVSRSIAELYVKAGYSSAERLMKDYGFIPISTDEARSLRSSVLYQPGYEPEIIKPRIDYIMETLSADYPDKVITDVLSNSHKSIYRTIMGISVWLGYSSAAEMMTAYGFSGLKETPGRAEIDHTLIIEQLVKRYDGKEKPRGLSELISENSDMKGALKTLSNKARELFGMPLLKYFIQTGIIVPKEKEEKATVTAVKRVQIEKDIRELYENSDTGYGTFEDAEDTFNQINVRRNSKGLTYVFGCSSCSETMRIPYGIDFIGWQAFTGQSDLVTLILPPTVREIHQAAFSDCDGLETIILPEGLEKIWDRAFSDCVSLKKIVFPESLKVIGNEAFSGCEELAEVIFGNIRTSVQDDAFDGCIYELEDLQDQGASPAEYFELKVDKKNNAKIIAYTGSEEIVVIPQMIGGHPIISIEKGCFKGNESVKEIYIHDHITMVNGDVFRDCKNLEKIHMSENVSKLTGTAFAGCESLIEVNVPDSMPVVPRGLFNDSPLTTIYIGKGVQSISPDAFYKGKADFATGYYIKKKVLENLIIDAGNESFSAIGTTLLSKDGRVLIAELGDPVKAVIPEGVEVIQAQAYEKLSSLCEVVFPHSLKRIEEKAFAGTNLQEVDFPEGLEEIGKQAFSFCRTLSSVSFNDDLKVIEQQAFEGCPIADVYIPASVERLGSDSFFAISTYQGETRQRFRIDTANASLIADGTALYQIEENGYSLIKAYDPALRLKPGEEGVEPVFYEVEKGTTVITPNAFARCNNLASVKLPEGLLSIGDMAFWDCTKLTEIHIPDSCTDVSPKAFFGININTI